jgi:hypothetical protein
MDHALGVRVYTPLIAAVPKFHDNGIALTTWSSVIRVDLAMCDLNAMKCRTRQRSFIFQIVQEAVRGSDMAAMMDFSYFSSGFIFLKPTKCSIAVWNLTRATVSRQQKKIREQGALNSAVKETYGNI